MEQAELKKTLDDLIADWENEVVEFKDGLSNFNTREIGKYFSALANEANLRNIKKAWLIFGVNDKQRTICGTNYREDGEKLQNLKNELGALAPNATFRDIHELITDKGRVLCLKYLQPQGAFLFHGMVTTTGEKEKVLHR